MIELDETMRAVRAQAHEWAAQLRPLALELDREPATIKRYLDLPAIRYMSRTPVPPGFDDEPIMIGGRRFRGFGGLERVLFCEEFAAGDAGALLAAPGPSMTGVLVATLGDEAQQRWFFERILARPIWTFFALTEPERGSDAGAMSSTLSAVPGDDAHLRLDGAKLYVGNAARAEIGVVFARTGPGPLGVTAVLVETDDPGFHAEPVPTIGLRGNQVTAVTMRSVTVDRSLILGRHLKPTRRGLLGAVRGLNRLRPGVAAIALGIARAAHEYVVEHRVSLHRHQRAEVDRLGRRVAGARQLIWRAALAVDADDPAMGYLASAAKGHAAQVAEEVTRAALTYFGPGARLEHPLLDKLARDARGLEFMEGTGNIQKLNVFQGLSQGKLS